MGPTCTTTFKCTASNLYLWKERLSLLSHFVLDQIYACIQKRSIFTQFILSSCNNAQRGSRSKHYMRTFFQLHSPATVYQSPSETCGLWTLGTNHKCPNYQSTLIFRSVYIIKHHLSS